MLFYLDFLDEENTLLFLFLEDVDWLTNQNAVRL